LISDKPTKLRNEVVLDWFGGKQPYLDWHAQWVSESNSKWFAEDDTEFWGVWAVKPPTHPKISAFSR
jgi:hypothetical protein